MPFALPLRRLARLGDEWWIVRGGEFHLPTLQFSNQSNEKLPRDDPTCGVSSAAAAQVAKATKMRGTCMMVEECGRSDRLFSFYTPSPSPLMPTHKLGDILNIDLIGTRYSSIFLIWSGFLSSCMSYILNGGDNATS